MCIYKLIIFLKETAPPSRKMYELQVPQNLDLFSGGGAGWKDRTEEAESKGADSRLRDPGLALPLARCRPGQVI